MFFFFSVVLFFCILFLVCSFFFCILFFLCVLFFCVVLFFFCIFFLSLFIFVSTELSGSSVTGALGGPGTGGSWLGCGLGRPVGCSSALGM